MRAKSFIRYTCVFVLCALGLAYIHGPAIVANWHATQWEDGKFFSYNAAEIHSLMDCFRKHDADPELYRPLSANIYYFLCGNKVEFYHGVNVLFLLLNSLLLYRLATLFLGPWWAGLPAVLFCTRYAPIEIVLHTCEFQELLPVSFVLLSVDLFIRCRRNRDVRLLACSALTFCLALLSKEPTVILPGLLLTWGWLFDERDEIWEWLVHPAIAVVWLTLYFFVIPRSGIYPTNFSVLNALRHYAAYVLTFPNWMTRFGDQIMPPRIADAAGTRVAQALVAILAGVDLALVAFRRWRVLAFGLAWFFIATLPYAVLDDRLFMRYSYLGHAGLALCIGVAAKGLFDEAFTNYFRAKRRTVATLASADPTVMRTAAPFCLRS